MPIPFLSPQLDDVYWVKLWLSLVWGAVMDTERREKLRGYGEKSPLKTVLQRILQHITAYFL